MLGGKGQRLDPEPCAAVPRLPIEGAVPILGPQVDAQLAGSERDHRAAQRFLLVGELEVHQGADNSPAHQGCGRCHPAKAASS